MRPQAPVQLYCISHEKPSCYRTDSDLPSYATPARTLQVGQSLGADFPVISQPEMILPILLTDPGNNKALAAVADPLRYRQSDASLATVEYRDPRHVVRSRAGVSVD